ncbi:MAG: hypothetical protein KID00_04450 [Clostridium argentinense]|uniref:Nitrogenase/oxidoreductase component 1 domain-containing protein n=1 Tax=Clostridium faecium TaxID=2762223 RepID=A0ABR8YWP9_9CLOT|nr:MULTISPECIES: nitrogenase component 1 [Clostridium]MBD8048707.1 hypothetical protein [Clostridium faecium]MBS5823106.1 hypothetical protein [Clostridium argentinense]MDU1347906.1 nitrogenase component 1 [Clostridium argentinense]
MNNSFLPLPNFRMGFLWTLLNIKNSAIVEYGVTSTSHYLNSTYEKFNVDKEGEIYCCQIDESHSLCGYIEPLKKVILEIYEYRKPEIIFVAPSSVYSIIGFDGEDFILNMDDKLEGKVIPLYFGNLKGDFSLGIREALKMLCDKVVEHPKEKKYMTYNIIGFTPDYYNFNSDLLEIKEIMLQGFGMRVNTIFTNRSSVEDIKKASEASFNIVIRSEGIDGAKILKDKYNMEYITPCIYGTSGTIEFIHSIERLTGIKCSSDYLEESKIKCREALVRFKHHARKSIDNTKCLVTGYYDVVNGISRFLEEELGIEIESVVINHNLKGEYMKLNEKIERKLYVNPTDSKKNELLNSNANLFLGDGEFIYGLNKSASKIQISNPNVKKVLIYDRKPLIGFNGMRFIMEEILQGIIS